MKNYLSTQECGNIKPTSMKMVCKVGMTQWNRNGFEFIWWYQTFLIIKKEDGLDEKNFFCVLTLLFLCPVGCLSLEKFGWNSKQGRDRETSGSNKIRFQSGQSYSYIERKVWYHQIWIKTYLNFIVLILCYIIGWNSRHFVRHYWKKRELSKI